MGWFRYFFGTPRRATRTALVIAAIVVLVWPGLLRTMLERLVVELTPLVGLVLTILIVFAGIRIILGGRRR